MKIIIPSAILIPGELRNLGNMPAIIYPVEGKPVMQYLYRLYKSSCTGFKIMCGEGAEQVHACLETYEKVTIEDIPEEEIKDLGYTIYCGIHDETEPIVINFGDTIVEDDITKKKADAFYYSEDALSDKWTFFEEDNGSITNVLDKTRTSASGSGRLFVGVFQIMDTRSFARCLEVAFSATEREESSFYHALRLYSQQRPMLAIHTDRWFDIGHMDKYYRTKMAVREREFNHITIDSNRGILKKTSEDVEKFIGEIKWYLKLPQDVEYVRPRVFSYSTAYENPFISMEYYSYHTLHELFLFSDLSRQQWCEIFKQIKFVLDDFQRYTVKGDTIIPSLEDMYLNKTLRRLTELKKGGRFVCFFSQPVTVNGSTYLSLDHIADLLKKIIPGFLYDVDFFTIIHGDLCFSNIMVDSNFSFIKIIDPRGKFGTYDIYGDARYEMAKLLHSVDGKYDYIIKDLFEVSYDLDHADIKYSILTRRMDFDLYKVFTEVFQEEIGKDLKKIELIEALLFLSMIPLHNESVEHQAVMLGTGLDILNRVVDITLAGGKKDV